MEGSFMYTEGSDFVILHAMVVYDVVFIWKDHSCTLRGVTLGSYMLSWYMMLRFMCVVYISVTSDTVYGRGRTSIDSFRVTVQKTQQVYSTGCKCM